MNAIICPVHKFTHSSANNSHVTGIHVSYNYNCVRFTIEGQVKYGSLKSELHINGANYQYAFEMDVECPDGYNCTNHATFTCKDRRGVIVKNEILMCIKGIHLALEVFHDKLLNEESVCCIAPVNELTTYKQYVIGGKLFLRVTKFKRFTGICKWIGKINNVECIGAEMVQWISNDSNGSIQGIKIFNCQPGHGVLLRCSDIEIDKTNPEQLTIDRNGFIDLKDIFYSKKRNAIQKKLLRIGRRAEILHYFDTDYNFGIKLIYGTVKWIGTINKGICVGVELDFPCHGAMNGVISGTESFECESGHGVVSPINSVTFDYYIHSVEFTVNETFNIDFEIVHFEDWSQEIAKKKDLKKNKNTFVHIEKHDRIFSEKGLLRWCGYVQGVSVGVLEMEDFFPITKQQKITEILKDVKPVSYIMVATEYLFKYRTTKTYRKAREGIEGFDIGSVTKFGTVKWQGTDGNDNLYYGFARNEPFEDGTNGSFHGQRLFDCEEGCGILISIPKIRETCSYKIDISKKAMDNDNISYDGIELLIRIANDQGIKSDVLLSEAMKMANKGVIGPLLDNITSPINISKHSDIINQLLESHSFDTLQMLIEKCTVEDDNNKLLLMVAAESLKYEKTELFGGCMNKCTNKDILMNNGETFITHIIKERIDQSQIIKAIGDFEFDITKANKDNYVPLTLACNNMMMDVVESIIRWNRNQESSKSVCSICMDRSITTVFNCGHNSCKECSENISQCHICKEVITSRGLLYFN